FTSNLLQLYEHPVRIFLRPTDFYRSVLARGPGAVKGTMGLLDEEVRQLLRGDIPYFFSLVGQDQIFWFDSTKSYRAARLSGQAALAELKRLPHWPLLSSQDDHNTLMQQCVESLISFFWNGYPIDASHAGISVSNDRAGLQVNSSGHYQPVGPST